MGEVKFTFDIKFQFEILRFICLDRNGRKALSLLKDDYFEVLPHAIIFYSLEKFYKKYKRIPGEVLLIEELKLVFKEPQFISNLTPIDHGSIFSMVKDLYSKPARDGDILLKKVAEFASFAKMRQTLESVRLEDFSSYKTFSNEVQKALRILDVEEENTGSFLLKELKKRQVRRRLSTNIIPTPFRQVNQLTNAGGYSKGSIIVILDKPKNLKSTMLINWARGSLRDKKRILYIDLENGMDEILIRLEQSISKLDKTTLLEGTQDPKIQKIFRRYARLKGEIFVQRLPAYSTVADISILMDELYRSHGIRFNTLIIDYMGIMGCLSKKQDDKERISDVYLEVANLALQYDIEHVITAHHIVREAEKRESTKYKDIDIAKCIDIVRHAQVIFGLNRTVEEREANIIRLEIVAQRDGVPAGRALFIGDIPLQKIDEMTVSQETEYKRILENVATQVERKGDI